MAYTVTRELIASFEDIEAMTTREFTANELVLGQNLLDRYQKEIETILRRPISVVVTEEPIVRDGPVTEDQAVVTKYRPVVSVSAIVPIDLPAAREERSRASPRFRQCVEHLWGLLRA